MSTITKNQLGNALIKSQQEILIFSQEFSDLIDSQETRINKLENSDTGFFYIDSDGDICQTEK